VPADCREESAALLGSFGTWAIVRSVVDAVVGLRQRGARLRVSDVDIRGGLGVRRAESGRAMIPTWPARSKPICWLSALKRRMHFRRRQAPSWTAVIPVGCEGPVYCERSVSGGHPHASAFVCTHGRGWATVGHQALMAMTRRFCLRLHPFGPTFCVEEFDAACSHRARSEVDLLAAYDEHCGRLGLISVNFLGRRT